MNLKFVLNFWLVHSGHLKRINFKKYKIKVISNYTNTIQSLILFSPSK